jgi:hypothetical protein
MTFGMISIAETTTDIITLDTPIEELNNLTLNEVFRDSNQWINNFQGITQSIDYISQYLTTSTFSRFLNPVIIDNYYYFNFNLKITDNLTSLWVLTNFTDSFYTLPQYVNQFHNYSFKLIARASELNGPYFYDSPFVQQTIFLMDIPYLINLTSLGISSLTHQQLDDYYDIYINGGYYEYDAVLNDLDMTDFIIISSSFVLWLWFIRFVKGVL